MNGNVGETLKRLAGATGDNRRKKSEIKPDYLPEMHAGERATRFVIPSLIKICFLLAVATLGALAVVSWLRGIGEPVPHHALTPDNKLDKPVRATAVDVSGDGDPRLMAADDRTLHVGTLIKDLHYWQRKPLKELEPALAAPNIVGLAPEGERLVVVSEKQGRRGLAAFTFPRDLREMKPWSQLIIDTSHAPCLDNETVAAMAVVPDSGERFLGGRGVVVYQVAKRRWAGTISREKDEILSSRVNDLIPTPGGRLAVLGDRGIDAGKWRDGKWVDPVQFTVESGLVGRDVKKGRFFASFSDGAASAGGDLLYLTSDRGLGSLRFSHLSENILPYSIVSEGRAPGLTRQSLLRASESRVRGDVWMVYKTPLENKAFQAALYQTSGHRMSGSRPEDAWQGQTDFTLAVDDHHKEHPAAWIGDRGLKRLTWSPQEGIEVVAAGLEDRKVTEITTAPETIFTKTHSLEGEPHRSVQVAERDGGEGNPSTAWETFIGPRRFPGLGFGDITAVADGLHLDNGQGRSAMFLGTAEKGLAVFDRRTRELYPVFEQETASGAVSRGTLDLMADPDGRLVQVGVERTLNYFNGREWQTLIPKSEIDIKPGEIRTVVASGADLVAGSGQRIAHYNAATHQWRFLQPLPGLDHLFIAAGRLWGIDQNRKLHYHPLITQEGGRWSKEDEQERIIDVHGDAGTIVVIGEKEGETRIWSRSLENQGKEILIASNSLPGNSNAWSAAAVQGGKLYLAPHGNGIGQYDLKTHKWEKIPFPSGTATAIKRLIAVPAGLWLLARNDSLFFLPAGQSEWQLASENIRGLAADQATVIALKNTGQVYISRNGRLPMDVLVGDALREPDDDIAAGTVFKNELFVATGKEVAIYRAENHHWEDMTPSGGGKIVQFAKTDLNLYALSDRGHVHRWNPGPAGGKTAGGQPWQRIEVENGQPLTARELSGHGGGLIGVLRTDGGVSVLPDDRPDQPLNLVSSEYIADNRPITAGAEVERDLLLASESGAIRAFVKQENSAWRWWPVKERDSSWGAVRRLLIPPGGGGRVVAVGDQIHLLGKNRDNGSWSPGRQLLAGIDVQDGEVNDRYFFGLIKEPVDGPRLWKASLDEKEDKTDRVLVGAGFPGKKNTTRAVGAASVRTPLIYRSDSAGNAAKYDPATHGWMADDALKDIDNFLTFNSRLWAWSKKNRQLQVLDADGWRTDAISWVQVVGDTEQMLMINEKGGLVLRTSAGDQTLIPDTGLSLPFSSAGDIAALAENESTLFLASRNGPLYSYRLDRHVWEKVEGPDRIIAFEKVGTENLFAFSAKGDLFLTAPGSEKWLEIRDVDHPEAKFIACVGGEKGLVALTDAGALLAFNGQGALLSAYRPGTLPDQNTAEINLAAAAEVDGFLVLAPETARGENRLWVYDPQTHQWESHGLEGRAVSFHKSEKSVWLKETDASGQYTLVRINEAEKPRPGFSVGPFLDVSAEGDVILAVNPEGQVVELSPDGALTRMPVAAAALPRDSAVRQAMGVGTDCGVLLEDGSVYHYTPERQWVERVPPSGLFAQNPGSLLSGNSGETLLLVRPNGEIYKADRQNGQWGKLPRTGDIINIDQDRAPKGKGDCTVVGRDAGYFFSVATGETPLVLKLENERLDLDRAERIALQGGSLWVKTPAAIRKYREKNGLWVEIFENIDQFPEDREDPVQFKGGLFALTRSEGGEFKGHGQRFRATMKLGRGDLVLKPVLAGRGLGFAHDLIRDATQTKDGVRLATAGGVVLLKTADDRMNMTQFEPVGPDGSYAGLERIWAQGEGLMVRTDGGEYLGKRSRRSGWSALGREQGGQAVADLESILQDNDYLDHWVLKNVDGEYRLHLVLARNEAIPVTLSADGFGFDRPRALAMQQDEIHLYTVDGMAVVKLDERAPAMIRLDSAYAWPRDGWPEVLEVYARNRLDEVWMETPESAWRNKGKDWERLESGEFRKVLERERPYFWVDEGIKWGRDDVFEMRSGDGEILRTGFRVETGRFEADMPLNLAVFEGDPWTVGPGGVVLYDDSGAWKAIVVPGQGFNPDEPPDILTVSDKGRERLLLIGRDGLLLEWKGKGWRKPADKRELQRLLDRRKTCLVDGAVWRLTRDGASGPPFILEARLVENGDFVSVALMDEGRFDFESVRTIVADGFELHLASLFGLTRIDSRTGEYTFMEKLESPVVRFGLYQKQLYALNAAGKVLQYGDGEWGASREDDVFTVLDDWIIDEYPWHWRRNGDDRPIRLEAGPGGVWPGPGLLEMDLVDGRFEFDAVREAGYGGTPWLVTPLGVFSRQGNRDMLLGGMLPVDPDRLKGRSQVLLNVQTELAPTLYARLRDGLFLLGDGGPTPAAGTSDRALEELAENRLAQNESFLVEKSRRKPLTVGIRSLSDPSGKYKESRFLDREGKFAFDLFSRVTRKGDTALVVALAATEGGVISCSSSASDWRLYSDRESDGISDAPVDDVVWSEREKLNLLLTRAGEMFRFQEDGLGSGLWSKAVDGDREIYKRVKEMIADEPEAWQVRVRPGNKMKFEIKWRERPTQLVDAAASGDAPNSGIRFAHDIPLSAAITGAGLWVGARGGVVRFESTDGTGHFSGGRFELFPRETLTSAELEGRTPPQGVDFLRPDRSGSVLYARRGRDNAVLKYEDGSWRAAGENETGYREAVVAASDTLWNWIKDSIEPVTMIPGKSFHLNDNYRYIDNGTWTFLDPDHPSPGDPRHTMVHYHGSLYLATPGGVSRFSTSVRNGGEAQTGAAGRRSFIDAVFGRSMSGGGWSDLKDVVELYVDRSDKMYARCKDGRIHGFDRNRDQWKVYDGDADPLKEAMIVVDNDLFKWTRKDGGYELLTIPLSEDMPDQTNYPLFSQGRFSFDEVNDFIVDDGRLFLGTEGGVCRYSSPDFQLQRIMASPFYTNGPIEKRDSLTDPGEDASEPSSRVRFTFISTASSGRDAPLYTLSPVREIFRNPSDQKTVLCRTEARHRFKWDEKKDNFTLLNQEDLAGDEYEDLYRSFCTREAPNKDNHRMTWVQYPFGALDHPEGALVAEFVSAENRRVTLGSDNSRAVFKLITRNRFSFDDVQSAVLLESKLLAATPAGIMEHRVDWPEQRAASVKIHCYTMDSERQDQVPLADLEGMVRLNNGDIMAWSGDHIYELVDPEGGRTDFGWKENTSLPIKRIGPEMLLRGSRGRKGWLLASYQDTGQPVRVTRLKGNKPAGTVKVNSRFQPVDMSKAVADQAWIYIPDPRGGLFRIRQSDVQ